MLCWTNQMIPTNLTRLEAPYGKQAKDFFKNILGWMGDKAMAYPVQLVDEMLTAGWKTPEIRDEIYIMCMKQLVRNPGIISRNKGWRLFHTLMYAFPPSDEVCRRTLCVCMWALL